jgi:hypothetical protein
MCGVIMLVGGGIAMALVNPEREAKRRQLQPLGASERAHRFRLKDNCCFSISPRREKHNLPDQLRVRPSSDRSGIA